MGLNVLNRTGGAWQAALAGELTIYTAAVLKDDIGRALAGCGDLEIDLAGVDEIDTAGLQLMLMAKRIAGKSVRFVNHSPPVLVLLELSRLAGAIGDPLVLPRQDSVIP